MSTKGLEVFYCDLCPKAMHPVHEARSAYACKQMCVHTDKYDMHIRCFNELVRRAINK